MKFGETDVTLDKGQALYVVPIGDIQSEEEYPRLKGLVDWLVQRRDEGHVVLIGPGMGDYCESPSPSDRAALNAAKKGYGVYEEMARDIERIYKTRIEEIASYFSPLTGSFIGLLEGHHWLQFVTPDHKHLLDTNRYLARLVGASYWGTDVQWTLNINNLPFKIYAHHGYGSARTPGARVMKRIRMRDVVLDANWYVMGHDDEKFVYPMEAFIGRKYFKQYFSGSGSFQRSYNFDKEEGTYAEKLLLPPAALGVVMGVIRVQESDHGPRLDYHIST